MKYIIGELCLKEGQDLGKQTRRASQAGETPFCEWWRGGAVTFRGRGCPVRLEPGQQLAVKAESALNLVGTGQPRKPQSGCRSYSWDVF